MTGKNNEDTVSPSVSVYVKTCCFPWPSALPRQAHRLAVSMLPVHVLILLQPPTPTPCQVWRKLGPAFKELSLQGR